MRSDGASEADWPPLIKAYLRFGAAVCGEAAWDPIFQTADVLMLLPMAAMTPRFRARLLRGQYPNAEWELGAPGEFGCGGKAARQRTQSKTLARRSRADVEFRQVLDCAGAPALSPPPTTARHVEGRAPE